MSLYNIKLYQNFCDEFLSGFYDKVASDDACKALILLPSSRACFELRKRFKKNIPRIYPLSSIESVFADTKDDLSVLSQYEQKLLLLEFILKRTKLKYCEAFEIVDELLDFITKFEREDVPLCEFDNLLLGDVPRKAELIFELLKIVSTDWYNFLYGRNKISETCRRNLYIKNLIEQWNVTPPVYPLIVAGSFGTYKSTNSLIEAVYRLEKGFVVVQGVEYLSSSNDINESHPSYQLHKLVLQFNLNIANVKSWSDSGQEINFKSDLCRYLVNSEFTSCLDSKTASKISYIECQSAREEISVIVDKIKDLKASQVNNIAIVTNDRMLSLKLSRSLELSKFSVDTNSLESVLFSKQMSFIFSVWEVFVSNFSPISLINLLRDQYFVFEDEDKAMVISDLEKNYLRGLRKYSDVTELIALCVCDGREDIASVLQKVSSTYKDSKLAQLDRYDDMLSEVINLSNTFASTGANNASLLWGDDIGQQVFCILSELLPHLSGIKMSREFFLEILKKLLEGCRLKCNFDSSDVKILTAIESRLLAFEYIIIAGINESAWRSNAKMDPFLGSVLHTQLGLESYKVKGGQAARDFISLLSSSKVLLTRSKINKRTVQMPYRMFDKLVSWAKKNSLILEERRFYIKSEFHKVDMYAKPRPCPEVALRPRNLSVTQVEKLVRDPYAIYASHILNLKPLDSLDRAPGVLEFGNIMHSIFHLFDKRAAAIEPCRYEEEIMKIGALLLSKIPSNAVVEKIWYPRIKKIAVWIAGYEKSIREHTSISSEVNASINIRNHHLIAKIDRIERSLDSLSVIDFKTGTVPSKKDVMLGFSPQLPLECLMLVDSDSDITGIDFSYIKIGYGNKPVKLIEMAIDAKKVLDEYRVGLKHLLSKYEEIGMPYLVCPILSKVPRYNEYEHLERLGETHFIS